LLSHAFAEQMRPVSLPWLSLAVRSIVESFIQDEQVPRNVITWVEVNMVYDHPIK
jgi:hypothetical protein